jgi:ubiquinone/menaquinone biosynthesis C-methylase UbiE
MDQVFKKYSKYYDLLYSDKDYKAEVEYIKNIILKYNPSAKTILDLGCGTGIHANLLASEGFKVTGVDYSSEMIEVANEKKMTDYLENKDSLNFISGDIRNIRLEEKYDVVVSLFHVFSYLNTNRDIKEGLETLNFHTKENGIIFFDFWYGPAVLNELPTCRVKKKENADFEVTRIATPQIIEMENKVVVNYELFINDKVENINYNFKEKHEMRYYFFPELDLFLESNPFKRKIELEWMKFEAPSISSWAACLILLK